MFLPPLRWPSAASKRSFYTTYTISPSLSSSFHLASNRCCHFSLNNSSSHSSGDGNPGSTPRLQKSQNSDVGTPKHISSSANDIIPTVSHVSIERNRPRKKLSQRSLWRRILFASTKVRSIIMLNVITLVYASNIAVLKEVEAIVDPASFTAVRFTVSAIPFIPFVIKSWGDTHTRNAGVELGFWVSLGYLMEALGLLTSDAGRASFMSILTVIVVPLFDGMLGASVPYTTWFGALMSITGVAMLESSGSPPSIGDLLNFLSAVFFGVHMLRTEHISRSTKRKNFLPLLGFEVCVLALFSTMWYFFQCSFGGIQDSNSSSWTLNMLWDWIVVFPWIPAIYTGIFSTGLCLWIEMDAMCNISATETAIIYGLEPVWGAGFAWFLLGERWDAIGWAGAALLLGGSLTVQLLALSPTQSRVKEERVDSISNQENGLSATPIVISSKKDSRNPFN